MQEAPKYLQEEVPSSFRRRSSLVAIKHSVIGDHFLTSCTQRNSVTTHKHRGNCSSTLILWIKWITLNGFVLYLCA